MTNQFKQDMWFSTVAIIMTCSLCLNVVLFMGWTFSKSDNAALHQRIDLHRMHSTQFSDTFVEVALEFPALSTSEQLIIAQYRTEHTHNR